MIRTIIYDLDDTLYSFHSLHPPAMEAMNQEAARRFGIEPDAFNRAFDETLDEHFEKSRQIYHHWLPADERNLSAKAKHENWSVDLAVIHSRSVRLVQTLERLHLPPLPHALDLYDIYWNDILDHMTPAPGIHETLRRLKQEGYVLGVGTNMTTRMQLRKIHRLELDPYFDFIVTSEECAVDKPDARFFDLVLKKASQSAGALLQPQECLFIGDNPLHDCIGASNTGLFSLWYNARGRDEAPYPQIPRIYHHEELFTHLSKGAFYEQ